MELSISTNSLSQTFVLYLGFSKASEITQGQKPYLGDSLEFWRGGAVWWIELIGGTHL